MLTWKFQGILSMLNALNCLNKLKQKELTTLSIPKRQRHHCKLLS